MKFKDIFTRKRYNLGVYFSSQRVSLLELCLDQNHLSVIQYVQCNEGSTHHHSYKTKSVNATIPNVKFIKKKVLFNSVLNNNDIRSDLDINQSHYFPGISDQLVFDFVVKDPRTKQGDDREVMIFAARSEEISQYQEKVKQFGLVLRFLEPENIALLRIVFYYHKSFKENEHYAAIFFIQNQYRLIVFSKSAVLHEEIKTTSRDSWDEEDVLLVCTMLQDAIQSLQLEAVAGCFLVSFKNISSGFISRLGKQQQSTLKVIYPFQYLNHEVVEAEALFAFGSALRGL